MGSPLKKTICFIYSKSGEEPKKATTGSAGYDLKAFLEEDIVLQPKSVTLVPTGVYFAIPSNFELQIRSRSGLALNHSIVVLNSPGTVDSDYRGEVKIILANLSDKEYCLRNGDRVAQAVISKLPDVDIQLISENEFKSLNASERGESGFGSTGK